MSDEEGFHTIQLKEGVIASDLYVTTLNYGDTRLHIKNNSQDSLTIDTFRDYITFYTSSRIHSPNRRKMNLLFSDGTVLAVDDPISPFRLVMGTEENDYLEKIFDSGSHTLYGLGGDDRLKGGEGNDILEGGLGNDQIEGEGGDDYLIGGKGDDRLKGDAGNDTYHFELGHGDDVITDYRGQNILSFAQGIAISDLKFYYKDRYSAILENRNSGDKLTLTNFFSNSEYRQFRLRFTNGTDISIQDEGSPFRFMSGTVESETITPVVDGITVYAGDGNDTLHGTKIVDYLYGEAGDDVLRGNSGHDTLDGGIGNDRLEGGAGDDIYIFGQGYGIDRVYDNQGQNLIQFLKGITPEELTITKSGSWDIAVSYQTDRLILSSYLSSTYHQNFTLTFADKRTAVIEAKGLGLRINETPKAEATDRPVSVSENLASGLSSAELPGSVQPAFGHNVSGSNPIKANPVKKDRSQTGQDTELAETAAEKTAADKQSALIPENAMTVMTPEVTASQVRPGEAAADIETLAAPVPDGETLVRPRSVEASGVQAANSQTEGTVSEPNSLAVQATSEASRAQIIDRALTDYPSVNTGQTVTYLEQSNPNLAPVAGQ